ncbi:MAG TPA: sigma-70 family RNA polymerase sigma factor [Gemmatimonadales bacterium]|jgi:RNA polymerase sigma-70 factor (ECF subfamily)|nr:sigma-70 family RNA polymerase sigma factor [Gemmatimonadales bacterium]
MTPADEASIALDALIARCADKVRLVSQTHRLDPADVDEVFQEVRIRVWKAIGESERIAGLPASYVYRTAESVALDFLRRRRARRDRSTDPIDTIAGLESQDTPGPDRLAARELGDLIEQSLGELAEGRRGVVRMYLAGYGTEEIGATLGWTEAKARNLVYRGLADLRAALGRHGVGSEGIR